MCYAMICRLCFKNNDDDHYRGFLRKRHMNLIITIQILLILWDIVQNSMIICLTSEKYEGITITTLEVQNYHFAFRDNMLGLFFNITTGSYLY